MDDIPLWSFELYPMEQEALSECSEEDCLEFKDLDSMVDLAPQAEDELPVRMLTLDAGSANMATWS